MINFFRRVWDNILNWIYPPSCFVCNQKKKDITNIVIESEESEYLFDVHVCKECHEYIVLHFGSFENFINEAIEDFLDHVHMEKE